MPIMEDVVGPRGVVRSLVRTLNIQSKTHNAPTTPITTKGTFQAPGSPIRVITTSGVRIAPMAAPLWRMPLPMVR